VSPRLEVNYIRWVNATTDGEGGPRRQVVILRCHLLDHCLLFLGILARDVHSDLAAIAVKMISVPPGLGEGEFVFPGPPTSRYSGFLSSLQLEGGP
jgi:hypothetical protein